MWNMFKPEEIEKRSFEIIRSELSQVVDLSDEEMWVLLRCIHTSADFEYVQNLYFSEDAVIGGIDALKNGATIITDTNMALSGISKVVLKGFGGQAICLINDEKVAEEAKQRGVTRAVVSMEHATKLYPEGVYAIGNAPTALLRLCELMENGEANPSLIIGAPVGFVNVVEAKEAVIASKAPCIVPRGRKGGSNIAAAIINAMLYGENAAGIKK